MRTMPFTDRPVDTLSDEPFEYINDFLNQYDSEDTVRTYTSALRVFADWLQENSGFYSTMNTWPLDPTFIDQDMLTSYHTDLRRSKRSRSSAHVQFSTAITFCTFLEAMNVLEVNLTRVKRTTRSRGRSHSNVAQHVVDFDVPRQRMPEIIGYYEAKKLPNNRNRRLTLLRNRALVNVLFFTAGRASEIASIRKDQVADGQTNILITGKGNKSRMVAIDDQCVLAIEEYLHERGEDGIETLFISHPRNPELAGKQIKRQTIHNVIKEAVKALRMHPKLSAHDFRHYRATQLLRDGIPLEVLQEYLGHQDISTTRNIYAPVIGAERVMDIVKSMGR